MRLRGWIRGATMAVTVLVAALWFAPSAKAHSHVSIGVGIAVPGVTIGVGNCWRCGYWSAPPVYYAPAYYAAPVYPAPVYYGAPAYYAPPPAYDGYSYGYYAPYRYYTPRRYYRRDGDRDRDRGWHRGHDGYYRHGHR